MVKVGDRVVCHTSSGKPIKSGVVIECGTVGYKVRLDQPGRPTLSNRSTLVDAWFFKERVKLDSN